MPGINTIIDFNPISDLKIDKASNILDKMNYYPAFSHELLFESPEIRSYFSGYSGYPREKILLGDVVILIDGAIYNKTIEQFKNEIAKAITNGNVNTSILKDIISNTDGEFVVYYIDKRNSFIAIFNDAIGRLPTYYHANEDGIIIARTMKFLTGLLPSVQVNDYSMIEYFLFAVSLGNKTFFNDIYRMMPYTLIQINLKDKKFIKTELFKYNFDDRWEDRPIEKYVMDLHDLFMESVANRAKRFKDRKQVLSLSGGLDSRANLMGLLQNKIEFESLSFLDHFHLLGRDRPVVNKLVEIFKFNHRNFDLKEENISDFEKVVNLKDGNGIMGTMGSVLSSMEITEREFGRNIVYYTGDEGNYITAPRYGGGKIESLPRLVEQIILKNSLSVYSINEVAGIFGKSSKEIMDYLCNYFSAYPEKDYIHKVDHFFIWERSFKFSLENQDRLRQHFWPLAPHYGIKYAPYAFKIKNSYLNGWKIYIGLLKSLDKRSVSVKYANFGIALDSPLMPIYLPLRAFATSNETIRRKLLVILRLLKNPFYITQKSQEYGYITELQNYAINLTSNDEFHKILHQYYKTFKNIITSEKNLF